MFISKEELVRIKDRLDYLTTKVRDLERDTKYYETSSIPTCSSYFSYYPNVEVCSVKTVLKLILDKLGLAIQVKPAEAKEIMLTKKEVVKDEEPLVKTEGFVTEKEDNGGK